MLRLPDSLRSALKTPMGDLVTDDGLAEAIEGADPLIGVGDVTCLSLLSGGHSPKLILVDYKSERRVMTPDDPRRAKLASYGDSCISVDNPPATITDGMMAAIDKALGGPGTWRIEVEGEEDLAVLPCMASAGEKAKIVYGMPGEGMVVVKNDTAMTTWAKAFMARMITADGENGGNDGEKP
jgi:uncharacterized protein (UPF0218 family)